MWSPSQDLHTYVYASLSAVSAIDRDHAVAVGWADNGSTERAHVFRTSNGGATWTRTIVRRPRTTSGEGLSDVKFVGASRGWAVGTAGLVLRTTDGGAHWTRLRSGVSESLTGVCFTSATRGWVMGASGAVLRTTTGGLSP